ncbi:DUF1579 domain-containing protein [Corallococcus sp. Z5C101001]|uniref:DUF1579 domain-containing protein n=1 Tax=Corallococcus sp. Z5C101001 TaxID=2596829 RepID=UPI00117F9570|nr:DUF1579 domain-containing protein [Corallococcus sp. Z5C101001]TSC25854.1 DUF1579 domain-containing protein [Corallococcus sp. Z5C101001]
MSQERLQQSQSAGGPHHFLSQLVGAWEGVARTWFEPDTVADESPITGTIRGVLDGRFVVHEYTSAMGGKPLSGMATLGYHLDGGHFTMVWVDTFHVGTDILNSVGTPGVSDRFSVLGSYFTGEQSPRWGWRTDIEVRGPDSLLITHFNIQPGEDAQKAIEIQYRRRS